MGTKSIDELADTLAGAAWHQETGPLPKYVYHYTDAAGLHGILTTKRVWATDCRFLNDETESELGKQRFRDDLRRVSLRDHPDEKRKLYVAFLDALNFERAEKNFVFSLSARKDDLSQWRMYAREGQGFTIGFETEKLLKTSKEADRFGFAKVSYNRALFDRRCRAAMETFERAVFNRPRTLDYSQAEEEASINLEWIITIYSVLFKHSSFMSEREWRINTYTNDGAPNVKVRVSGNRLIPYIELDLCGVGEDCLPVSQIGIGPGYRESSTRYAVERLLENTNTNAQIYDADTPYRRI